jgi:hypothetical protein
MLNKVVTESDSNKLTDLMTEAERKAFLYRSSDRMYGVMIIDISSKDQTF